MRYKPLTLYYLQQLGIKPWINKVCKTKRALIIISPSSLGKKPSLILKGILAFIKTLSLPYRLIELDFSNLNQEDEHLPGLLQNTRPLAILSLGLETKPFLDLRIPCPIFYSLSPLDLLQGSNAKKQIFEYLMSLA
jgi:hypothetical protein